MRVTSPAVTIKAIWDALVADYGVAGSYGLLVETNLDEKVSVVDAVADAIKVKTDAYLDAKVSEAKADLSTLETRLSAARATALDELLAANLPTDIAAIIGYLDTEIAAILAAVDTEVAAILADVTGLAGAAMRGTDGVDTATMRGTDGAALASAWTAALATILGNFSAARIGYLDNIDSSLKELFYEHFASTVDDISGVEATGTATSPTYLIENDDTECAEFTLNEYVDINFGAPVYIKQLRYKDGTLAGDENGSYSLSAWIDGSWVVVKTGLPTRKYTWSSWIDLTTPSVAVRWRVKCTAIDTDENKNKGYEFEFKGVRIG